NFFDTIHLCQILKTLFLLKKGCRIRILAHLGRPQGKRVNGLSLRPLERRLKHILRRRVIFVSNPLGADAYRSFDTSRDILFFENLRFWKGEEGNSREFAKSLSRWGDIYVNEAFSDSHRAHASIVRLAQLIPSYAGIRFSEEVRFLARALKNPRRPFLVVLGGAKVSTKLPLIRRFLGRADRIIIAGAMANTVFFLRGTAIGHSIAERDKTHILPKKLLSSSKILYPVDARVVDHRRIAKSAIRVRDTNAIQAGDFIVDIGPRSLAAFYREAKRARTILWNGPLGYTDERRFEDGTKKFAFALSRLRSFRIVGGGETIGVINRFGLLNTFSHVSTGGGAMLEFLMGKKLPGISVLMS
ncbi:MAG: phosphoglycerate kinase, partial [Patescibacteria group bacterium]